MLTATAAEFVPQNIDDIPSKLTLQDIILLAIDLPPTGIIINIDNISKILSSLCTLKTSPIQMIVTNYYNSNNKAAKKIFDPIKQWNWCKENSDSKANFFHYTKMMRNYIVHNKFIDNGLVRKFLIVCYRSCLRYEYYSATHYEKMLSQCVKIHQILLGNIQIEPNFTFGSPKDSAEATSSTRNTLHWFKTNGYMDYLKNLPILLTDGKYKGKYFIFRSWSGTTVKVYSEAEEKIITLSVNQEISVLI